MLEYFKNIQVGLDIGTSLALVASAFGITWRLVRFSRTLEREREDRQDRQSEVSVISHRENIRITGLTSVISECEAHIQNIFLSFRGDSTNHDIGIYQDSIDWVASVESRLLIYGNQDQLNAIANAKEEIIKSVKATGGGSTRFSPRDFARALIELQRTLAIDVRTYLRPVKEEDPEKFVDDYMKRRFYS